MKFSLLTSVSSVAFGAGLALSAVTPAHAGGTLTTIYGYTNSDALVGLPPPNSCFSDSTCGLSEAAAQSYFGNVQIAKFVPGTNQSLTQVVITEAGTTKATGSITNASTSGSHFTVDYRTFVSLASTNAPASFPISLTGNNDPSASFTVPGSGTHAITLTGVIAGGSTTLTTGLTGFTSGSPANFTVNFLGTGVQRESGSNSEDFSLVGSAIGSIAVTYSYTTTVPTPEPASLAIVGSAMAGLGVIRRRRRKA